MKDLLIFPYGGNAKETLLITFAQNRVKPTWNILGFVDENNSLFGVECCGVKVLGGKKIFNSHPKAKVVAVPGRPDNFWLRKKIIQQLGLKPVRFATQIHPSAQISEDAIVGVNSVVMSGCVISTGTVIGNHCVILPNTVISHDSHIGDYTLIGSNVSISGGVRVGKLCYLGTGSRIIEEIRIGNCSLIGIGSVVIDSIKKESIVAGCPARFIRSLKEYKAHKLNL